MGVLGAGMELDGCRIEELIGRGGMGVVYRARQFDLDRDVAVKVITPERIDDERARARFLSEARAAAAVEHPNVLPIQRAGVVDGQAYLVMRYGARHAWASVTADGSVARYDPRTSLVLTNEAARRPAGLPVAAGRVFVVSDTDHTVVTLGPKTGRPVGDPLAVPPDPWAVAAGAGHVWVSGLGSNTLTRIDY